MLGLNMDFEVTLPCCLMAAHWTAPHWPRGGRNLRHHGVTEGSWKNKARRRNVSHKIKFGIILWIKKEYILLLTTSGGTKQWMVEVQNQILSWYLLLCFRRASLLGQNFAQIEQWCPSLRCLVSMCFTRLCFQALSYPHSTHRHTVEPFSLISLDTKASTAAERFIKSHFNCKHGNIYSMFRSKFNIVLNFCAS